jgi:hypothetical protein
LRAWLALPIAAVIALAGALTMTPAGAIPAGAVSNTGICFGKPAGGGCSVFGGGTTAAIVGSTQEFGAAFTATDGVSTGQQILLDGSGSGITFSSDVGDFDVVNDGVNELCKTAGVTLSNAGQTASVTMSSGCAATPGTAVEVLAFNTVVPSTAGTFSLSLSTTADAAPSGTNLLSVDELPSPPQDASAGRALQSITVAWSAPSFLGTPALTGYDVYCSSGTPSTGDTPSATTDAATTSATVSAPTAHTAENCVVTAVNEAGQSDATGIVSAVPYELPSPPGSGPSTVSGNHTVMLQWGHSEEVGGTPIVAYRAYCSTSYPPTVSAGDLCGTFGPKQRSGSISGLPNGVPFYVGMTAVNKVGESILSAIANPTPVGPPSRVWSLRAKPFHRSIELRWKVPTSDGGEAITGYDIYCSTDDPPVVTGLPTTTATTNRVRVSGLTKGTPYYCVVFATNGVGRSKASVVVTATPF